MDYDGKRVETYRDFLKDCIRLSMDFSQTDQSKGIPPPPLEKPFTADEERIDLLPMEDWKSISNVDLISAIQSRRSHRKFRSEPLTLEELSVLLWATQGVREVVNASTAFRMVPSAGSRHAFETYLCVLNVSGLNAGIYRYLPFEHQLLVVLREQRLSEKLVVATLGQSFAGTASVTFVWTTIPYRMEWRYGLASYKVIAMDAGHVCQNLYLACSAIEAGTCGVAAYNQKLMDELLRVDGTDEFTIYLAPVGKI